MTADTTLGRKATATASDVYRGTTTTQLIIATLIALTYGRCFMIASWKPESFVRGPTQGFNAGSMMTNKLCPR
jgi:hypothetical protein